MKFISNAFKNKTQDERIYEISYMDLSSSESGLAEFVPERKRRTDFVHHENLDFDDITKRQQNLKTQFEENGGNAAQNIYAKFGNEAAFKTFKDELVEFFKLFDLDPKSSSNSENHFLIMTSNHKGFEGQDILSLSREDLEKALKSPYVVEQEEVEDEATDMESVGSLSDKSAVGSGSSLLKGQYKGYLLDVANLEQKKAEILKSNPESEEELEMFDMLILDAKDNALKVAVEIQKQHHHEEEMEQVQEELKQLEVMMLMEDDEKRQNFERIRADLGLGGAVQDTAIGPYTSAILEGRQNEGQDSQMSR